MALPFHLLATVKRYGELARARQRLDGIDDRDKAQEDRAWVRRGVSIALTNGALFGWGWINEKYGSPSPGAAETGPKNVAVAGIPLDVIVGGAMLAVGFLGVFGKTGSDCAINFGNGSLGAFAYRMGAELGHGWARSQHQPTTSVGPSRERAGAARVGPQGGRLHTVYVATP